MLSVVSKIAKGVAGGVATAVKTTAREATELAVPVIASGVGVTAQVGGDVTGLNGLGVYSVSNVIAPITGQLPNHSMNFRNRFFTERAGLVTNSTPVLPQNGPSNSGPNQS